MDVEPEIMIYAFLIVMNKIPWAIKKNQNFIRKYLLPAFCDIGPMPEIETKYKEQMEELFSAMITFF